jgi:hypothetical protein
MRANIARRVTARSSEGEQSVTKECAQARPQNANVTSLLTGQRCSCHCSAGGWILDPSDSSHQHSIASQHHSASVDTFRADGISPSRTSPGGEPQAETLTPKVVETYDMMMYMAVGSFRNGSGDATSVSLEFPTSSLPISTHVIQRAIFHIQFHIAFLISSC